MNPNRKPNLANMCRCPNNCVGYRFEDDGVKFCGQCGTRMIPSSCCVHCGKEHLEKDFGSFCTKCGHTLERSEKLESLILTAKATLVGALPRIPSGIFFKLIHSRLDVMSRRGDFFYGFDMISL